MVRMVLFAFTSALLLACSDSAPTELSGPEHSITLSGDPIFSGPDPGTQQQCIPGEPGCIGSGGSGATGVNLGMSMLQCYIDGPNPLSGVDADNDNLDDECEWRIASSFAPRLKFANDETASARETFWSAHRKIACGGWYTTGVSVYCQGYNEVIRVAYLLGYHLDNGPQGHKGDSEFLILEAWYDDQALRWMMNRVYMSAHYAAPGPGPGSDSSRWWYAHELEYPNLSLWYPNVWVSVGKHGNYPSDQICDSSGWAGLDSCDGGGISERVEVLSNRNIGEYNTQLINGVSLPGSPYPYIGTEYFWSGTDFAGWWSNGDNILPYKTVLQTYMMDPNGWDTTNIVW